MTMVDYGWSFIGPVKLASETEHGLELPTNVKSVKVSWKALIKLLPDSCANTFPKPKTNINHMIQEGSQYSRAAVQHTLRSLW